MTNPIVGRIIEEVSVVTGVPFATMTGPSRCKSVAASRFMAFGLLKHNTLLSPKEIAGVFNRDRTTFLNGVEQFEHRVKHDPTFREMHRMVVSNLNGTLAVDKPDGRGVNPNPPTAAQIVAAVSDASGVSIDDIMGQPREQDARTARHVAMRLMRELTPLSFPEIAHALCMSNHSTVITALQRLNQSEAFTAIEGKARAALASIPQK